jgi:hypothetical protein
MRMGYVRFSAGRAASIADTDFEADKGRPSLVTANTAERFDSNQSLGNSSCTFPSSSELVYIKRINQSYWRCSSWIANVGYPDLTGLSRKEPHHGANLAECKWQIESR